MDPGAAGRSEYLGLHRSNEPARLRLDVSGGCQRRADPDGDGAGVEERPGIRSIDSAGHDHLHPRERCKHVSEVGRPGEAPWKELDELGAERKSRLDLRRSQRAGNRCNAELPAAPDRLRHEGRRHACLGAGGDGRLRLLRSAHGASQDRQLRQLAESFDGGEGALGVQRDLDDTNAAREERLDDPVDVRNAPKDGDDAFGTDTIERRRRLSHVRHHHPATMTSAVVTGSNGGIGSATVSVFGDAGFKVQGLDVDDDAAAVFGALDTLDALVCAHGVSGRSLGDGPVDTCTEEAWDTVLETNLRSVYVYCKHAIPLLRAAGGGAVVTVSSVLGLVGGDEDFATHAYAASKAGLIGLTRAMAASYAKEGIRCNVVCPGLIATPMSRRAQEDPRIVERLPELQPLTGGFGKPEDVAQAALYLATAPFVTGAVLTVDGGWTAR